MLIIESNKIICMREMEKSHPMHAI